MQAQPPLIIRYLILSASESLLCLSGDSFSASSPFSASVIHSSSYAVFSLFNAAALGYAIGKLVGVKESWEDLRVEQWGQALAVVRAMFM